jgi:hypothetical protein
MVTRSNGHSINAWDSQSGELWRRTYGDAGSSGSCPYKISRIHAIVVLINVVHLDPDLKQRESGNTAECK